jgi:SAM-dependent methyltransferase
MATIFAFYGAQYSRFGSELAAEMRREVYGDDAGQQGWRTPDEDAEIAEKLRLGPESDVLDVACGSGGPSLALALRTGCRLTGFDVEGAAIAHAQAQAAIRGLAGRATFAVLDCCAPLPRSDESFDAILCVDAINHLPDRALTISDWARLLRPGGRLVFTDPMVITGAVAKDELDVRASQGYALFVPPGQDERAIEAAGLTLVSRDDRSAAAARIAGRWHSVRERRAQVLEQQEGVEWFRQRQRFLAMTATLAASGRLSRFLYVAEKRPGTISPIT